MAEENKEKKHADDEHHGSAKKEDVAAEATVPETGETAKVDSKGRPETNEQYGQDD